MSENETFDATRKLLLNIRSVRVFARETSFEQLLEMQEKLNAVIEEGRGRTPKPIDEALKAGRSLDEFLIKKDASSSVGDEQ